jgi:hypothetical protein
VSIIWAGYIFIWKTSDQAPYFQLGKQRRKQGELDFQSSEYFIYTSAVLFDIGQQVFSISERESKRLLC